MIVRYTFTIDNEYDDGTFEKSVYFEGECYPSKKEVIAALELENEKEHQLEKDRPEWGPFVFEYEACLGTISRCLQFPTLYSRLVHTSEKASTLLGRPGSIAATRLDPIPLVQAFKTGNQC